MLTRFNFPRVFYLKEAKTLTFTVKSAFKHFEK